MKPHRYFWRACMMIPVFALLLFPCSAGITKMLKKDKPPEPTPLDRYIEEAMKSAAASTVPFSSPGSIWTPASRLTDLGRDLRASDVDDLVTVLVVEHASAAAKGVTKTQRQSSTNNSISGLAGITRKTGPRANLAKLSGTTQLDGQG